VTVFPTSLSGIEASLGPVPELPTPLLVLLLVDPELLDADPLLDDGPPPVLPPDDDATPPLLVLLLPELDPLDPLSPLKPPVPPLEQASSMALAMVATQAFVFISLVLRRATRRAASFGPPPHARPFGRDAAPGWLAAHRASGFKRGYVEELWRPGTAVSIHKPRQITAQQTPSPS
jgi:hypothetical protein